MNNYRRSAYTFLFFITVLLVVSCSSADDNQLNLPDDKLSSSVSVCSVNQDMVGEAVNLSGKIAFKDESNVLGKFFQIEEEGCRLGVFVEQTVWEKWEADRKDDFAIGSTVEVSGVLANQRGELVIELLPEISASDDQFFSGQDADIQMGGKPDPAIEEVNLCDLDASLSNETLRVVGKITFLDKANPEGVYFDLEEDGCQVGVWIKQNNFDRLEQTQKDLLTMNAKIFVEGMVHLENGEFILEFVSLGKSIQEIVQLDPDEKWWTQPQTYHDGEGPDADFTPLMNITALHDWSSLLWGFAPEPEAYWTEEAIRTRWNEAHARGMRVEAVVSIIDMFFIEYGPEDDIYSSSGIDLFGDHIEYDDPVGFVGCTNQHGWQEFTREKIFKAIDWGADGIIIDDYEGTSRWTSGVPVGTGGFENGPGGCFCSACEAGFRNYLNKKYSEDELATFGIMDINSFDYSDYLIEQGWTVEKLGEESIKFSGWDADAEIIAPLYQDYADFQNQEVVTFLNELKEESLDYAKEKYNKEISWSVNAGELNYGFHKFYEMFDRNVGGIRFLNVPPRGSEGYHYRLSYQVDDNPRLRGYPGANIIFLAVMNEYQANNLWTLKGAEAYANQGALVEYDYFVFEGGGLEEEAAAVQNDPDAKRAYNTFYLENAELFDFQSNISVAKVAVLYSSPSIHYDIFRHTQSFNGICEILTDLHVQFDPILIGDGISYPDNLNEDLIAGYDMVFLPNVYAMTNSQTTALLNYTQTGGTLVGLGEMGVVDETGKSVAFEQLDEIKKNAMSTVGDGDMYYLYQPTYQLDGVFIEDLHDPAAIYYQYYIENNHPRVEEFLYLIEEEPSPHITDLTAAGIRAEIADIIDQSISSRIVKDTFSENIGAQVYLQKNQKPKMIVHLLNYNYELETDKFNEQGNIELVLEIPDEISISNVVLLSPDIEETIHLDFEIKGRYLYLTVPHLYIWDVVVIE